MIGAFPPPMHGMAAVNDSVRAQLQAAGAAPQIIDLATPSLDRSLMGRLGRLPKVIRGLVRFANMRFSQGGTLYMSVSGGLGQLYEVAFLVLARSCRMRVFLHHHSFSYLDRPNQLTALIVKIAGQSALHIALSEWMANRLKSVYKVAHVKVLSNAAFFVSEDEPSRTTLRQRLETLGFLSNISFEKGVFDFLNLFTLLRDAGLPVRGKLAGPFQDKKTERQVRKHLTKLPDLEYLGPQYGADKKAFLETIDVLVFPTRYVNEAEPLTLHEAMRSGLPVIAYGRGAIPEIVGAESGKVVDLAEPFVPAASAQIRAWICDPEAFVAASTAAAHRFSETYDQNEKRWFELMTELLGEEAVCSRK